MSQAILDDDRTGETEAQLSLNTDASPRRAAIEKVIPIPMILPIVAILISSGACAWVTLYNPLGKGISKYDFSTPKKSLISEFEIAAHNDIRAQFELPNRLMARLCKELLKKLKVHREAEWQGKKILFITGEMNGIEVYGTEAFEKDAETGFWMSASAPADAVERDNKRLAVMMREWKERGSGHSDSKSDAVRYFEKTLESLDEVLESLDEVLGSIDTTEDEK